MQHTAPFIPNPKLRAPGKLHAHHINRRPSPIARVFAGLAELGIKAPPKIEPDPLALVPAVVPEAADQRQLANAVAAGTLTSSALAGMVVDPADERRRIREASHIASQARHQMYAEHHQAMIDAAPSILASLDKALGKLLDEATATGTYGRTDYEARYLRIHQTAATVDHYFATTIDHPSAREAIFDRWWRFADPLAEWQWEHEVWATAPKKAWNTCQQVNYGGLGTIQMVGFTGTGPTLEDIVHHRDEWQPRVSRAEDVAQAMTALTAGPSVE